MSVRVKYGISFGLLSAVLIISGLVGPAASAEPELRAAARVFDTYSSHERFEIPMLLMANGNYNGMSNGQFGPRLFRGIKDYQSSIGVVQTGYLSSGELARLRSDGYRAMSGWGLSEVSHPFADAKLYVPKKIAPNQSYTKRGLAFEAADRTVSVDFSFFTASETTLEALYARLGSANVDRVIDYKVIRPLFFVVAGHTSDRNFYTKYQFARGGIVGFTTSWDSIRVYRGDRIANLMVNLFFVPQVEGGGAETNQVALPPANALTPAPSTPPTVVVPPVAAAPDPKPQPKSDNGEGGSGTGFFIRPKRMLTNAHVVEGCEAVIVTIGNSKGPARVLARDKSNDLALVETEATNETTAKLRAGVKLGEDVAAFGFPLYGLLATSGNFTRGGVTATAGLRDDSSQLQISAPVQPGNSGGPLLDESGNVVGVVVSKLKVLQLAMITGDFAQNVNFAIKSSVAQTFLETHGTDFDIGAPGETMKPADLAARAQSFSGVITCRP